MANLQVEEDTSCRVPPHSLEMEQALLGAMLCEGEAINVAEELVEAQDFYRDQHRHIFKAIVDVRKPDVVLVADYLDGKGLLDQVGNLAYLISLRDDTVPANTRLYARKVSDYAKRRNAIDAYYSGITAAYDTSNNDYIVDLESMSKSLDDNEPLVVDARTLLSRELQKPHWAVRGILPEGLGLLCGKPKQGKSFLTLNLGLGIAYGGRVLDREVEYGEVLILALEDSERRLQDRLSVMLGETAPPDSLHLATRWPRLTDGGLEELDRWLSLHPDCRLVVVDTIQKVRERVRGQRDVYGDDYRTIEPLKRLADDHHIALLAVHHLRKSESIEDPLDEVSGSTGLTGAADTVMLLRGSRGRTDAELMVIGRDLEDAEYALDFDSGNCAWQMRGLATDYRHSEERQQIIEVLGEAEQPLGPHEVAQRLGKNESTTRNLMARMTEQGELRRKGYGKYVIAIDSVDSVDTSECNEVSTADLPVDTVDSSPSIDEQLSTVSTVSTGP